MTLHDLRIDALDWLDRQRLWQWARANVDLIIAVTVLAVALTIGFGCVGPVDQETHQQFVGTPAPSGVHDRPASPATAAGLRPGEHYSEERP